MKLLLLLLGCLSTSFLTGQVTLTGWVLDDTGAPLSFANVRLLTSETGNLVTGNTTSTEGQFTLTAPMGRYQLQIDFLGYEAYTQELDLNATTELPSFYLKTAANELTEITVLGDRPIIEQHEDQLLFNVAASPLGKGYDGLEVLERAPNVWLSDDGTLQIRNAAAQVLINGRQLRMEPAELGAYLQAIPSENILRIEIRATPGAATTADVAGGVINIILKRPVRGISGGGRTAYLYRGNASWSALGGINLNYGGKHWNVYGHYDYLGNHQNRQRLSSTAYFLSGNLLDDRQEVLDTFQRHNFRIGTVFRPHPRHTLGAEFAGTNSGFIFDQLGFVSFAHGEELLETGLTTLVGNQDRDNRNLTLNYRWDIDSAGTTLQVYGDFAEGRSRASNQNTSNYDRGYFTGTSDRNQTDNRTKIYDLQADLEHSLINSLRITSGAKWTATNRQNHLLAESLDAAGWQVNDRSSTFNYQENILAGYVTLSQQIDKRHFLKVGLRAESTRLTKTDLLDGSVISQRYLNWFPSIFLSRKLSDDQTLSFSFTKRVRRPSFTQLNNNVFKLNDFRFELGNPDLAPEFPHRYELALQHKKHNFALYHSKVIDAINGIYFLEGEVSFYKKFNEGRQTEFGLEYNGTTKLTTWWSIRSSVRAFRRQFIDAAEQELFQQNTFKVRAWNYLQLSKRTKLEIRGTYYTPQADAYFIREPIYEVDAMLQRQWLKGRLVFRCHVRDILNTVRFANRRPFETFVTTTDYRPITRTINLRLNYTFAGKQEVSTRSNRSRNEALRRL